MKMSDVYKGEICTSSYAKYRIQHPDWIFDSISDCCKDGSFLLAVDVGCGSGQSCQQLCRHFLSVIGLDISEDQIKMAQSKYGHDDKIEFRVGQAENLSFIDNDTVDLVTAGVSMHWFDIPKFLLEAKRVLKTGGVCAVYSYMLPRADCPDVESFFNELIPFMDPRIQHFWDKYTGVQFPFQVVKRQEYVHTVESSVESFLGFLRSLSAWQSFTDKNPDAAGHLQETLRKFYYDDKTGETRTMHLCYDYVLILCRK
ncbi:hypothetical protein CHS0354_007812 [Potamilus streckersoni]|uniref:Methyltransferase type 11 domain-containing protein n=1 Tax=Potamilus streckersoni TaxID=2493646 RepID=A0AAE0VIH2_9BIVA|nr:hypothetical protein CHS0354_007812 [Potamilus streckersoni]